MENQNNRRSFIRKAALGGLMAVSIPEILSASSFSEGSRKNRLMKDNVILFQGDSITDAGRKREAKESNNQSALGGGYAFLAAAEILKTFAMKNFHVYNKGISGNKVYQLAERWQTDCLDLKPAVLSILIGVNDFGTSIEVITKGQLRFMNQIIEPYLNELKSNYPKLSL